MILLEERDQGHLHRHTKHPINASRLLENEYQTVRQIEDLTPVNYEQGAICDDLLACFVNFLEPNDLRVMEGMSRQWRYFARRRRQKIKSYVEEVYFSECQLHLYLPQESRTLLYTSTNLQFSINDLKALSKIFDESVINKLRISIDAESITSNKCHSLSKYIVRKIFPNITEDATIVIDQRSLASSNPGSFVNRIIRSAEGPKRQLQIPHLPSVIDRQTLMDIVHTISSRTFNKLYLDVRTLLGSKHNAYFITTAHCLRMARMPFLEDINLQFIENFDFQGIVQLLSYIRRPNSSLKRVNILLPYYFIDFGAALVGPGKKPMKVTDEEIMFAEVCTPNHLIWKACKVRFRSQLIRTKPKVTKMPSTESEDYPLDYRSYIRIEKKKMREAFNILMEIVEIEK